MKYKLPTNVTLNQQLPERYTKETKLQFTDSSYGTFSSTVKAMEDAGKRAGTDPLSTHPKAIQERRVKTNIQKYGSSNPALNEDVRAKMKATVKGKYGVENPSQAQSIKDKKRDTLLQNYGVTNPMHSEEVKTRLKSTIKKKYGVDNIAKNLKIQQRMKDTSLRKYGYSNPMHNAEVREKQLRQVLSKYEESDKLNILPNGKYVSEYCSEFNTNPSPQYANKIYKQFSPELAQEWIERHKSSVSNLEILFERLASDLGAVRVNKKVSDSHKYRPDIKINDSLYVDLDGLLYHSEKYKKDNHYHNEKRKAYLADNTTLLQFRADELVKRPEVIKSMLNLKLGRVEHRHFARKLDIREVKANDAYAFLEENHLMGGMWNTKTIGLYSGSELLMLVSYKYYRKKKDPYLELDRVCSKTNTSIVGGLSRLLKEIIKRESPSKVVSFVDLRYADGHSLAKLGFTKVSENTSWKWTDGHFTYNRRKAHSRKEAEAKGWYRIYDAGQAKFVLDLT
jgi:hypothetical protein